MSDLSAKIKEWHGAIAFIEMEDDSIWEVGIIPRCKIDEIDIEQLRLCQAHQKCHLYSMYRSKKLNVGYIEAFDIINSEIKLIDGVSAVLYGIIIAESLLPLGKAELLCYKKTEGIEEFPSEE